MGGGRRSGATHTHRPCVLGCWLPAIAMQQKMRSDGNYFPSGRKVLTEGFKEAAAGGPE